MTLEEDHPPGDLGNSGWGDADECFGGGAWKRARGRKNVTYRGLVHTGTWKDWPCSGTCLSVAGAACGGRMGGEAGGVGRS